MSNEEMKLVDSFMLDDERKVQPRLDYMEDIKTYYESLGYKITWRINYTVDRNNTFIFMKNTPKDILDRYSREVSVKGSEQVLEELYTSPVFAPYVAQNIDILYKIHLSKDLTKKVNGLVIKYFKIKYKLKYFKNKVFRGN